MSQGPIQDLDVIAAQGDWAPTSTPSTGRPSSLPEELGDALGNLFDQLEKVTQHAPVVALKAVAELELPLTQAASQAADEVEEDEMSWETVGASLGISAEAARARVTS